MSENPMLKIVEGGIPFSKRAELKALELSPENIKLMMPLKPNVNHVGTMYAGALFTLAEMVGGAVAMVYFMGDPKSKGMFPIVKSLNIKFTKPARTDITVEYSMDPKDAEKLISECAEVGKSNYDFNLELKDETGLVVAVTEGFYQLRKGKF